MKQNKYKHYNKHTDCPQKLWENRITINCEDEPQWRELMMDYQVKKYVKKPIPVEAMQYNDEFILDCFKDQLIHIDEDTPRPPCKYKEEATRK